MTDIKRNFGLVRVLLLSAMLLGAVFTSFAKKEKENFHTPRYYSSRAENYQETQSWDASKREIDEGLKLYPNDPDLRYLNGRYYYYAVGDLQQARYNLVKAVQENDQHFRARRVLVDVEDDSKHYSSAICYVNELLEFQPYDRDLWRRKISLYTKIGQKTEADHALERLARIFPDDSLVRKEFSNRNRDAWNKRLQSSSLTDAASDLERWIELEPDNIDYYIELVKTYQNIGDYERAIGAANRGLNYHPSNQYLIRVAASMMAELGDYTRALAFLRSKHVNSGPLYTNMMREAASDARWRDPYEAHGRLYAASGDRDALNYLLNTSITRGYYSDAVDYLNEAYKKYGRLPELLMKQYALEKRFGNEKEAMALLEELYRVTPTNEEILDDYTALMLTLANRDIEQEQWTDAYNHLKKALSLMPADSTSAWPAAISRQISVLGRLNKFDEARELFNQATDSMPQFRDRFGYAYEEIAALRLKTLIENENYNRALIEAEALLKVVPNSEVGLRTAINMAQTLGRQQVFREYAELGYKEYPEQPYFIIKRAAALQDNGEYDKALALLKPKTDEEYVNPQILQSFVGMSEEYAGKLLKDRKPELALQVIDTALYYNSGNKDLLYMKGLAYGQMREFGLAWEYQHKYYNPSNAEQAEWYQQMRYLKFRSYRNRLDVEYTAAFHDTQYEGLQSIGHLYSIGSISYSHLTTNNTYTGTIRYKGVDGYVEGDYIEKGGFGFDFAFQWDHTFNSRWSGMINASYCTKYFNKLGANLGVTCDVGKGWLFGLKAGYKLSAPMTNIDTSGIGDMRRYNIFILTPSAEKSWAKIKTSLAVDVVNMGKGIYYNVGWKGKLFVNENNISSVGLMAGFGSFPELNFFDQFFNRSGINSFSHTNAMAGIEGIALLTNNFFISLAGTWNTYYNPVIIGMSWKDFYKNVFGISLGLHMAF